MKQSHVVLVVFACPDCGEPYVAAQEHRQAFGSFDCWDCKAEIFCWSGEYQYTGWDRIDPIEVDGSVRLPEK